MGSNEAWETVRPAPPAGGGVRRGRVEAEILRAAARGGAADLPVGKSGRKPRVKAAFLRDLWLGLIPGATIHPSGIELRGLRIVGALDVRGVSHPAGQDGPLCALVARDCEFNGQIALGGASIEMLVLERCRLIGGPVEGEPLRISLGCSAMDVAGECSLDEIEANHPIELGRARIGRGLFITGSRKVPPINMSGARIGGMLLISRCDFAPCPAGCVIDSTLAAVEGPVIIGHVTTDGALLLSDIRAMSMAIANCRAGLIVLTGAQIASGLSVNRTRLLDWLDLIRVRVGGSIMISGLIVRPGTPGLMSLVLASAEVGMAIRISRCRLDGGIGMRAIRATMQVVIDRCRIRGTGIDFSLGSTGDLTIAHSWIGGEINLANCRLGGGLVLDGVAVDGHLAAPHDGAVAIPPAAPPGEAADDARDGDGETGVDAVEPLGIFLNNANIGADVTIRRTAIRGTLFGSGIEVGRSFTMTESWFDAGRFAWSILMGGLHSDLFLIFDRCLIGSGAALPLLRCTELQVHGSTFAGNDHPEHSGVALWLSDSTIRRQAKFAAVRAKGRGGAPRCNDFSGLIDLSNSSIGKDFYLASTTARAPVESKDFSVSIAVDLGGSTIAGDCRIADQPFDQRRRASHYNRPAEIHGCIRLDDATVTGDVIVHRTVITALGTVARPGSGFASEERVTKRKRGVALSLRDATVRGELEIGRPKIHGLVDLRGAVVGLLADGGGARWRTAGVRPGQLLLEGFRYQRLDLIDDAPESGTAPAIIGNVSVSAERRLDWLLMQFADGRASADTFVPQPYEQLARIFGEEGNERARRRVLVAKRDMQRRYGRVGRFERSIGWILKVTSEYGYSPFHATASLILFIALGTLLAYVLDAHGAIVLANVDSSPANPMNPIAFAIDSALPIIDLRQDSVFTIDVDKLPPPFNSRALVTLVRTAYELIGLVLVSIAVLTLTGTLRDKD